MSTSGPSTALIHIEIEENTDYNLRINYTEPSTGLPVDLTGYQAELFVDENMGDAGAVFLFNTGVNGGITLSGSGGEITVTISSAVTNGLGMFRGTYSLYLVSPNPDLIRTKISKGFFTVSSSTLGPGNVFSPVIPPAGFNLTGPITSVGYETSVASQTGTGSTFVMQTSPALVTPDLGTPTALVGTNITGTAVGFTAGTVITNANLTGEVTSTGNSTFVSNSAVISKVLTGFSALPGTVTSSDSILSALEKIYALINPVSFFLSYVPSGTTSMAYRKDTIYFVTVASAPTTFQITGLPGAGSVATWSMEITNGGLFPPTWFTNTRWDGGVAPTLTSAGTDVLTFYTIDGGSNIRGFLAAKDSK